MVGGSGAGMLTSLMLGRAGHDVVLFEQDGLAVAPDVELAAREAYRPAAPQLVQPHVVMARCRLILAEHLPEVLAALIGAGALEVPLADQLTVAMPALDPLPGDDAIPHHHDPTPADLFAATTVDPVAFRAWCGLRGMLRRPEDVYQDPEVVAAVREVQAQGLPASAAGPAASALSAALNP